MADANASEITELYRRYLGRAPDTEGLQYWDQTGLGADEVLRNLLSSTEFNSAPQRATPEAALNNLISQLQSQQQGGARQLYNTSGYDEGGGLDALTADFAKQLQQLGITDLRQVGRGEVPKYGLSGVEVAYDYDAPGANEYEPKRIFTVVSPDGTRRPATSEEAATFHDDGWGGGYVMTRQGTQQGAINLATGQPLQQGVNIRDGSFLGGTQHDRYAGTNYNVQFDSQGNPIFGADFDKSDTGGYLSGLGETVKEGFQSPIGGILAGFLVPGLGSLLGSIAPGALSGLTSAIGSSATNALLSSGLRTAITGGDITDIIRSVATAGLLPDLSTILDTLGVDASALDSGFNPEDFDVGSFPSDGVVQPDLTDYLGGGTPGIEGFDIFDGLDPGAVAGGIDYDSLYDAFGAAPPMPLAEAQAMYQQFADGTIDLSPAQIQQVEAALAAGQNTGLAAQNTSNGAMSLDEARSLLEQQRDGYISLTPDELARIEQAYSTVDSVPATVLGSTPPPTNPTFGGLPDFSYSGPPTEISSTPVTPVIQPDTGAGGYDLEQLFGGNNPTDAPASPYGQGNEGPGLETLLGLGAGAAGVAAVAGGLGGAGAAAGTPTAQTTPVDPNAPQEPLSELEQVDLGPGTPPIVPATPGAGTLFGMTPAQLAQLVGQLGPLLGAGAAGAAAGGGGGGSGGGIATLPTGPNRYGLVEQAGTASGPGIRSTDYYTRPRLG